MVLERLDPATLHLVLTSPVARQLGAGAVLLAGGTHDVWVVSGVGRPGLWCVNGQTGAEAQSWTLTSSAVAADNGRAVAVTGGHVRPLLLGGSG